MVDLLRKHLWSRHHQFMLMPIFSAKPQKKSPTHRPQATNFGSRVFHTTEDSNGKVSVCFFQNWHVCHFGNDDRHHLLIVISYVNLLPAPIIHDLDVHRSSPRLGTRWYIVIGFYQKSPRSSLSYQFLTTPLLGFTYQLACASWQQNPVL